LHTKNAEEEKGSDTTRIGKEEEEEIELLVCEISLLDASYVIRSGIYEP
jgi:hypothetical protein